MTDPQPETGRSMRILKSEVSSLHEDEPELPRTQPPN